ncbi:hypothetical protein G6L86_18655 [Agrobacterium tumefaciens]|uniref:hypothetical protein n=1 Tax=Agrobacterium tumefaciens TaxID=358 RepID=UPI0015748C23|nr:hypothetical protein [Agrobacterium tumefaciens]NSX87628.1 hypothetical protein [Agrobacterium tumefaciens]
MKKISPQRKWRLVALGLARWRHQITRKGKVYNHLSRRRQEIKIVAPEVLSFKENFSETIAFLDEFRDLALNGEDVSYNIYVDLKPIKTLSVPVAIVLAADFDRWRLITKYRLTIRESQKWAPTVRNLLSDLGVFQLLGLRPVSHDLNHDNFTLTPLMSGERTDGYKIDLLQEQFSDVLAGFTKNPEMFAGLMEAAENAIAHGYPENYKPPHPFAGHRWWAASCLDPHLMTLRFFVYDQGAGIPFTLPTATIYEQVRARLAQVFGDLIPNDSLMLRAALEVGRTRTGLDHRGLGLKRMSDVVTGAEKGYLRILSGKGEIVYHADETIETRDHDHHIGGTLIEWSMSADAFTTSEEMPNEND